VTANLFSPPTSAQVIDEWLIELVKLVDMKILFGPHSTFCETEGNEGVTGVVCIETSHASIHVWHKLEKPFVKFDLYSCKDFSTEVVLNHLDQFGLNGYEYMIIDRNNGLTVKEHVKG
jgi:S-adenosylmethionine/arginine decarboxylase-like enzyme